MSEKFKSIGSTIIKNECIRLTAQYLEVKFDTAKEYLYKGFPAKTEKHDMNGVNSIIDRYKKLDEQRKKDILNGKD